MTTLLHHFSHAKYQYTWGNITVVRRLLAAGVDPNLKDPQGYTALHFAAQHTNADLIMELLAAGADVSAENNHGTIPLIMAVKAGKLWTVRMLIRFGSKIDCPGASSTPLTMAVINENHEIVKELLDRGADPNIVNIHGKTPLYYATTPRIVFELIDAGANLETKYEQGYTVLHLAVINHDYPIVEALVECGANVHAKNIGGVTPLKYARDPEMISLLTSE